MAHRGKQFEFEEPEPMHDEPILSEQEHRDLRNLLNKNISMDFILEMREAFQLFDKVCVLVGQA